MRIKPVFLLVVIACAACIVCYFAGSHRRYTEKELNKLIAQSIVRNKSSQTLKSIAVLEQIRQGSLSNAVEKLETDLGSDIEQLQTILKQADIPESYRDQIATSLFQVESYRKSYPRQSKPPSK